MSRRNIQDYVSGEVTIEKVGKFEVKRPSNLADYDKNEISIERVEVRRTSSPAETNQINKESAVMTSEAEDEMHVQVIKEEVVNDVDSEGEEYYIITDEMDMSEIPANIPYLRAALSAEDPNGENNPPFLVLDASSNSTFLVGGNNGHLVKSEVNSPVYIYTSKEEYESEDHARDLDFSERINLKYPSSSNNKNNGYDSGIVIYPVENSKQNNKATKMYPYNTGSGSRTVKNERNNSLQIGDLQMQDSEKMIIKSVHRSETHPFKCKECGESFELKSHFVMHELGHEKYKFYSFRTNTVKYICIRCKKPYLYSANNKELNSNMCNACLVQLREKLAPYTSDKGKENVTKRHLEIPDISTISKAKKRKQCYSCGGSSDRYFVYGASLLCSHCWQNRIQKSRRSYKPRRTSIQRGSDQRHNSGFTRCVERYPFKNQVPDFQCDNEEENPRLIGTHFLLSELDTSHTNSDEDEDQGDCQEFQDDCSEVEISTTEEETESSTVILCERTGKFIDIKPSV